MMRNRFILFYLFIMSLSLGAQSFMINPYGRSAISLNGKWDAIIDLYDKGEKAKFFLDAQPLNKSDFIEYAFDHSIKLDVPSDWNSQLPELEYYEGTLWYRRVFDFNLMPGKRHFVYFAAANYIAKVWLNGQYLGEHEGGFTPFQFEVTSALKQGENKLIVSIDNRRKKENIPAMNFDWWNYGGLTRDVLLISTPPIFIKDYLVQLQKGRNNLIKGYIRLSDSISEQEVELSIPELQIKKVYRTDSNGLAEFELKCQPQAWTCEIPKLYQVALSYKNEKIEEPIGFRTIEVKGRDILLNGKPIYLKGISCHEEIPQRKGRAVSLADAAMILSEVKALGCNFFRLTHYPQAEKMVKEAERL